MASNRWVAIDPDILTHPLVGAGQPVSPADPTRGAYSRMEAWLWIICNASFQDHTVMNRGRKMTLQRGDLLGAWAFLAHTFNWSAKQVRSWVESLISDNMLQRRAIEQQEAGKEDEKADVYYGNQATILSIVNYWRFQFESEGQNARENSPNEPYNNGNQNGNHLGNQNGNHLGNQFEELSASKLADKYILQQQLGQPVGQALGTPVGQPKGQHITSKITTVTDIQLPLSEASSDEKATEETPRKKPRRKHAAEYSEQFETFWAGYPDRTNNSKPKAFEAWDRLEEPEQNAAIASLPTFLAYCRKNPEYRCVHAERYLSQRRWESHEPKAIHAVWWQDKAQLAQLTFERWRYGIATHANGLWPVDKLGPPPGSPQCVVPRELIAELRLTERYDHNGIARKR